MNTRHIAKETKRKNPQKNQTNKKIKQKQKIQIQNETRKDIPCKNTHNTITTKINSTNPTQNKA